MIQLLFIILSLVTLSFASINYKGVVQPNGKEDYTPSDGLGFFDLNLQYVRKVGSEIWLSWTPDTQNGQVLFALAVNTTGWIGLGVSETGGMVAAEICAIYDGKAYTYWSPNFTYPTLSTNQHCNLLNYTQFNGESMAIFTRSIISCKPFGIDIYEEWDNRWIFAFGDTQTFSFHGSENVGTSEFNALLGPPPEYELPDDTQVYMSIMEPHQLPPLRDIYLCKPREFPSDRRYHIVLVEPYFPNSIYPAQHHHLNLFACPSGAWPPAYSDGAQKECTNPLGMECPEYWYSWLMGQSSSYYMEAGLPIGQGTNAIFIVMQEHIDNPNSQGDLFDGGWGLSMYYTPTLRPEECGNLGMFQFLPTVGIPPRTPNFTIWSECGNGCTSAGIPETGVTIMAVAPHMHLVGFSMGIQHFRFNQSLNQWVELPLIHSLNHWDPNWQGWRNRRQNIVVLPGDWLRMWCSYDSSDYDHPVYNGEGYDDEMCLMPIMVRPRIAATGCGSIDYGLTDKGNSFCIIDVAPVIVPQDPEFEYIPRQEEPNQCNNEN